MTENNTECIWRTPDGIMRRINMRKDKRRRQSLSTLSSNSSSFRSQFSPRSFGLSATSKRLNPFSTSAIGTDVNEVSNTAGLFLWHKINRPNQELQILIRGK